MKWRHLLILIVCVMCKACLAREPCAQVLQYAEQELPYWGVLKQLGAFVYVDVDDAYIHQLISFIQQEGFKEPPYFGSRDLVGAHITVAYPEEMREYGIGTIHECGNAISFIPKRCATVHPSHWQGIDQVYILVVDAPELDNLRKKYGLSQPVHPFHITIGVK